MANPASRQGLIDYCLRELGHPVLEINLDDDQIEDRIDEAFQFYREYHYDAVEMVYLSTVVAASVLTISGVNAALFTNTEKIVGLSSGAYTYVNSNIAANKISCTGTVGTFTAGETIQGSSSGTTAAFSSIALGNYDTGYIEVSDAVVGINRILPLTATANGVGMFDARYQIFLNDFYSIQSTDLIYYSQIKSQLNLISDMLVGQKPVRFNRHMNRVYVDMNWEQSAPIGTYIVVEAYRILDPDTFTDVYNDMYLKKYATACLKRQWGNNLKKFEGVQLPGGVTLNGQKIYDEAIDELKQLKDEVASNYQLPVDFFTG